MVTALCSISFEHTGSGFRAMFTGEEECGPRAFSPISEWDALAQLIRTTSERFDFEVDFKGCPGNFTATIAGIDDTASGEYVDEALAALIERHHAKLGFAFVRVEEERSPQVFLIPNGRMGGLSLVLVVLV